MHFLGKLENERKSSKNLLYRNWFGGDIQKFNRSWDFLVIGGWFLRDLGLKKMYKHEWIKNILNRKNKRRF